MALYAIQVFGTFPPLAASWRMTSLWSQTFILDEPFVFPESKLAVVFGTSAKEAILATHHELSNRAIRSRLCLPGESYLCR